MLIYSGDYVFDLGIHDVINQAARNIGANLIENGDVVPNPHIDLVRNLIDQARAADVDFILAVGGASSFDTAKAVGVGLEYDGDVWDLFTGVAEPQSSVSVGVISRLPRTVFHSERSFGIRGQITRRGPEGGTGGRQAIRGGSSGFEESHRTALAVSNHVQSLLSGHRFGE